ncbi:hypothetical protein THAOC_07885, partial [Thalassiosira oceanica]
MILHLGLAEKEELRVRRVNRGDKAVAFAWPASEWTSRLIRSCLVELATRRRLIASRPVESIDRRKGKAGGASLSRLRQRGSSLRRLDGISSEPDSQTQTPRKKLGRAFADAGSGAATISLVLGGAKMMLLAVLLGCAVLFGPAAAEKVVIHDIVAAQHTRQHQRAKTNPFVSSTVSVTVAPLPRTGSPPRSGPELGDAIADFYGRLFAGQDEYDVKIVAVSLLDGRSEYVAGGGTRRELFNVRRQSFGPESEAGGRKLLTNSLQHVKFSRDDDDYVRRNEPNDVSAAT